MKNLSLILLALAALNSPVTSAADKNNCESSDPLLKSENVECFPENDYFKINKPVYNFAGADQEILLNSPMLAHDICRKFGGERAETYKFYPLYSYFKSGYDMANNKIANKSGTLSPIESITCKFTKIVSQQMAPKANTAVTLKGDFVLVANGNNRSSKDKEKAEIVADRYCRAAGYIGAFEATTIDAPTKGVINISDNHGYYFPHDLAYSGRNAIEISSSGDLQKVALKTYVKENIIQSTATAIDPLILEKVVCYKAVPRDQE